MDKRASIVAMIPARMGSMRLAMKNLALVNGKPLIYYAIKAAKDSGVFSRVVVNSEDIVFGRIAKRYNVEFYQRPAEWASSAAESDLVVYDFLMNNPCDAVAWVNPISPLQTGKEVARVVNWFMREGLDSLITVKDEQVHCVYEGKPINFRKDEVFAKTQDLAPVRPFVYSVMMWRSKVFLRAFRERGHAILCGKVGYYGVSKISSIIIKTEEDLMLADYITRGISKGRYKVRYDKLARLG